VMELFHPTTLQLELKTKSRSSHRNTPSSQLLVSGLKPQQLSMHRETLRN
jgi:hypothetical protein